MLESYYGNYNKHPKFATNLILQSIELIGLHHNLFL